MIAKKLISSIFILGFLGLGTSTALSTSTATQYPHEGDSFFDGIDFADVWMSTHAPYGRWQTSPGYTPGLEIDINTPIGFFSTCTTWSDFPKFYDDCVTAGVSESGKNAAIGTYDARLLQQAATYIGEWSFSGISGPASTITITWQEVAKTTCWWESPWCMVGIGGSYGAGRFTTTNWVPGQTQFVFWSY